MNQVYRNKYHAGAKGLLLIVLMGVVAMASPAHAKPDKMQVCHLDAKGDFKLKDLPQGPYLGHLIHHEGDIVPVNGECVFETFEIGDTGPGGGIVFYLDGSGGGLEAAPTDQGYAPWGCYGTTINGADGLTVGTGAQNTTDILNGCNQAGIAAKIANDYVLGAFDDWFLPSQDELNRMYQNLYLEGLGGFALDYYWSSSETVYQNLAWGQYFSNGGQDVNYKLNSGRVRAVRAF